MLNSLRHLFPTGMAFRLAIETQLKQTITGIANVFSDARDYVDASYNDLFPQSTRDLDKWEAQFAISRASSDDDRRLALASAWQATGGQSPSYIQTSLRAAGFDVYVHEPYPIVDPRDYTRQPLIGTNRCGLFPSIAKGCSSFSSQARCNRFLNNEPGYIVNLDLTRRAPPAVPADPNTWPFFVYISGLALTDTAFVDADRRAEFERLLLTICPAYVWIVTNVVYGSFIVDASDPLLFDFGLGGGSE